MWISIRTGLSGSSEAGRATHSSGRTKTRWRGVSRRARQPAPPSAFVAREVAGLREEEVEVAHRAERWVRIVEEREGGALEGDDLDASGAQRADGRGERLEQAIRPGAGAGDFFEDEFGHGRGQRRDAAATRHQRREPLRGDRERGDLEFRRIPVLLIRRKSGSSELLGDRAGVALLDGRHCRRGTGGVTRVGEEALGLESDARD